MKENYTRLKATLLAGAIALTSAGLTGCGEKKDNNISGPIVMDRQTVKEFGVGEHIISKPINADIRKEIYQYDYIPGYEPVGISVSSYGTYASSFGGATILYRNIEEVSCSSNNFDYNGVTLYLDFGTPISGNVPVNNVNDEAGSIREFAPGEHIISVPLTQDIRSDSFQYTPVAGYEIVGVATSAYGTYSSSYGGGALLYKNVEPVKCTASDRGYTSFGTPISYNDSIGYNY